MQTRCDLCLVFAGGVTYGIPVGGNLPNWAEHKDPEKLAVVVPSGTAIESTGTYGDHFVECDFFGLRVLVPWELIERH